MLTHGSSERFWNKSLRFGAYVVPHGPLQPVTSPASHSASGILASVAIHPFVWQSLHPAIIARYLPVDVETAPLEDFSARDEFGTSKSAANITIRDHDDCLFILLLPSDIK
jgi:hypothetical protein